MPREHLVLWHWSCADAEPCLGQGDSKGEPPAVSRDSSLCLGTGNMAPKVLVTGTLLRTLELLSRATSISNLTTVSKAN